MTIRDSERLVAVYDTDIAARGAVRALEHAGVDVAQVRVGDDRDRLAAIEGEMRGELTDTVKGPGNIGPFTKEMSEGSLIGALVGGGIGLVIALPFAAIGIGGLALWARLVICGIAGLVIGATAGWIIAGAFAAKRPDEPLDAERGVTVAVPLSAGARDALVASKPRRLDVVAPDGHGSATWCTTGNLRSTSCTTSDATWGVRSAAGDLRPCPAATS
jgi:hypothetical protein